MKWSYWCKYNYSCTLSLFRPLRGTLTAARLASRMSFPMHAFTRTRTALAWSSNSAIFSLQHSLASCKQKKNSILRLSFLKSREFCTQALKCQKSFFFSWMKYERKCSRIENRFYDIIDFSYSIQANFIDPPPPKPTVS